jgi:glycyl-tRNA synthetase beta subunit
MVQVGYIPRFSLYAIYTTEGRRPIHNIIIKFDNQAIMAMTSILFKSDRIKFIGRFVGYTTRGSQLHVYGKINTV